MSLRQIRSAILLSLMALVVGLVFIGSSSSEEIDGVSPEELQDLSVLADQEGISIQDAIRGYGWRDDLSAVTQVIWETYPDDFAHSRKPSPNSAWLSFSGEVPQGAKDMISDFTDIYPHVTVDVIPNAGFTRNEKRAGMRAVHSAMLDHSDVKNVGARVNLDTMTIEARVMLKDTAADAVLEDLKSSGETRLISATRSDILNTFSVSVAEVDSLGTLDSGVQHREGEELNVTADEGCTSGFVGEDSDYNRGVITASHCGEDAMTDDGSPMSYQSAHDHYGPRGDVQWRRGT